MIDSKIGNVILVDRQAAFIESLQVECPKCGMKVKPDYYFEDFRKCAFCMTQEEWMKYYNTSNTEIFKTKQLC